VPAAEVLTFSELDEFSCLVGGVAVCVMAILSVLESVRVSVRCLMSIDQVKLTFSMDTDTNVYGC